MLSGCLRRTPETYHSGRSRAGDRHLKFHDQRDNLTIDCEDPGRLAEFWSQALEMEVLGDYGEFVFLGREGSPVNVGLQRVPERRSGKNRLHIDLRGEPRAAAAERLEGLGATVKEEHSQPGLAWIVLRDPEGNEFCIGEHTS